MWIMQRKQKQNEVGKKLERKREMWKTLKENRTVLMKKNILKEIYFVNKIKYIFYAFTQALLHHMLLLKEHHKK